MPHAEKTQYRANMGVDIDEQDAKKLKSLLRDRGWRLSHLYKIQGQHPVTGKPQRMTFAPNWAQRQLLQGFWYFNLLLKARQLGMCLTPDTRILTADLRWVKLGDIQVGTEIVAVDESVPGGKGRARKMRTGIVEKKISMMADTWRITFDDGRSVVCTDNHPWLSKKKASQTSWRTLSGRGNTLVTGKLTVGTRVRSITVPWSDTRTYEDGWVGGMLDGEGSMSRSSAAGGEVNVSQVAGAVFDRMEEYLRRNNYNYRIEVDNTPQRESKWGNTAVDKLCVSRMDEMFRLLGVTRPTRFLENNRRFWEGKELPGKRNVDSRAWVKIVGIDHVGRQEVVDLQTSTKTYIAEGLVSHNTTLMCIMALDYAMFNPDKRCGIIAHNREDAEDFFSGKIRYAYDNLPEWLREAKPTTTDSKTKLEFANGSSVRVGTSLRSGTYNFLHISEFGKVCARDPAKAREIVTGGINTVHNGDYCIIESTAEGREGYFYEYSQAAMKRMLSGEPLGRQQFKFWFFPWWRDPKYQENPEIITITSEYEEYFNDLAAKGIELTDRQKAWYVAKAEIQGEDMRREFPSTPAEAFEANIEGAYYTRQMTRIRLEKRITSVPYNPMYPVNTFWDIGINDQMAIWFHQDIGGEHRLIDYIQGTDEGLQYYVNQLLNERRYSYGIHYMPHDAKRRSQHDGMRFDDYARRYGLRDITVIPRAKSTEEVLEGIEAVRGMLGMCVIDGAKCDAGIKCLDNYRKEWDANTGSYKRRPLHNWASNGADALRTGAVGHRTQMKVNEADLTPEWFEDI